MAPSVIAGSNNLGFTGHGVISTAARSAVTNIATQGIALATGLQSKFDWTGVAAAAAGSGVGRFAGRALPGSAHINAAGKQVSATWSNRLGASMASSIADAATRSAIDGTSFGDNLRASIPNVIGQAIGRAVNSEIAAYLASGNDGTVQADTASVQAELDTSIAELTPPNASISDEAPSIVDAPLFSPKNALNRLRISQSLAPETTHTGPWSLIEYTEPERVLERVIVRPTPEQRTAHLAFMDTTRLAEPFAVERTPSDNRGGMRPPALGGLFGRAGSGGLVGFAVAVTGTGLVAWADYYSRSVGRRYS